MESQRYPDDFDGIVAGAPAYNWPGIGAGFVQTQQKIYPDPANLASPVITNANRALLAKEILAACDKLDGVEDRLLDDPRQCKFDPAKLPRCADAKGGADCVTEAQLQRSRRSTKGRSSTASASTPGSLSAARTTSAVGTCGSPAAPMPQAGPAQPALAFGTNMFKYIIYDDPKWDYSKYQFANWIRTPRARPRSSTPPTSTSPSSGVRGASSSSGTAGPTRRSPRSAPSATTSGWRPRTSGSGRLRAAVPAARRAPLRRRPGPDKVDWLTAISEWVEKDKAPERLLASRTDGNGKTVLSRPLCPYPQVAIYDGKGDPAVAESFACGAR